MLRILFHKKFTRNQKKKEKKKYLKKKDHCHIVSLH